jgi:hypothetical protein
MLPSATDSSAAPVPPALFPNGRELEMELHAELSRLLSESRKSPRNEPLFDRMRAILGELRTLRTIVPALSFTRRE